MLVSQVNTINLNDLPEYVRDGQNVSLAQEQRRQILSQILGDKNAASLMGMGREYIFINSDPNGIEIALLGSQLGDLRLVFHYDLNFNPQDTEVSKHVNIFVNLECKLNADFLLEYIHTGKLNHRTLLT